MRHLNALVSPTSHRRVFAQLLHFPREKLSKFVLPAMSTYNMVFRYEHRITELIRNMIFAVHRPTARCMLEILAPVSVMRDFIRAAELATVKALHPPQQSRYLRDKDEQDDDR